MTGSYPIPPIPGTLVTGEQAYHLKEHVANLCHMRSSRFPGSQPVSFSKDSIRMLEKEDFWVCEKSDGVRVLVLILFNRMANVQEIFLIDRREEYRQITGITFHNLSLPPNQRSVPLSDTILDGELVIDIDTITQEQTLRFYAFDCIVYSGENLFSKPLEKRYGRLQAWITPPSAYAMHPNTPPPFEIVLKKMELAYGIQAVLDEHIPRLQHGHDGLIFTCCKSGYVPGTDPKILKWKPPSENSIDFKLELRFPSLAPQPSPGDFPASSSALSPDGIDYSMKPIFWLYQWLGGEEYERFEQMTVEDEEWEEMKASGVQYDDAIIEVVWDIQHQGWKITRVRDDKMHGNHSSTVQSVISSIIDGVEAEELLEHAASIKQHHRRRQQQQQQQRHPPSSFQTPSHSSHHSPHPHQQQQQQLLHPSSRPSSSSANYVPQPRPPIPQRPSGGGGFGGLPPRPAAGSATVGGLKRV